jgi:Domain of unknown function (DUF4349)
VTYTGSAKLGFHSSSVNATRLRIRCLPLLGAMGLIAFTTVSASGCGRHDSGLGQTMASVSVAKAAASPQATNTLSREHTIVVDVPETELAGGFRRVSDRCTTDSEHHCTILQSDLSSGDAPSGLIRLRIDPTAVEDLVAFVASQGKVERRSTQVEDLADAMADTQARIEMLTNYRQQLLALQVKAGANVEAAIKLASELSTVQTDLERVNGEAAYQTKRVTTDIVRIEFLVAEHKAFWRPVREAVRDFLGNLSMGLSQAITAIAYIVPWLFVVVPGLYLLRLLWRKRGK